MERHIAPLGPGRLCISRARGRCHQVTLAGPDGHCEVFLSSVMAAAGPLSSDSVWCCSRALGPHPMAMLGPHSVWGLPAVHPQAGSISLRAPPHSPTPASDTPSQGRAALRTLCGCDGLTRTDVPGRIGVLGRIGVFRGTGVGPPPSSTAITEAPGGLHPGPQLPLAVTPVPCSPLGAGGAAPRPVCAGAGGRCAVGPQARAECGPLARAGAGLMGLLTQWERVPCPRQQARGT